MTSATSNEATVEATPLRTSKSVTKFNHYLRQK